MGLDTSHDCWHGPYSAFMRWPVDLSADAETDPSANANWTIRTPLTTSNKRKLPAPQQTVLSTKRSPKSSISAPGVEVAATVRRF